MRNILIIVNVLLLTFLAGCSSEVSDVFSQKESLEEGPVLGAVLYAFEKFDGNDRTCATCHVPFTFQLSVDDVADAFAEDPTGPLFRSVDADIEGGNTYSLMLADGLVRVHVSLGSNVTVDEIGSPDVSVMPNGQFVVSLRRSTPTSINTFFQDHLMWDGREAADLAHQANSAIHDHAEPGREPLQSELNSLAAFQRLLFSSQELYNYSQGGPPPGLPAGVTDSEQRGRTFFVDGPLSAQNPANRGLCATCHSGPLLDTTNAFNPGDPPGLRFAGNGIAEVNPRNKPVYTYRVALPYDLVVPPGTLLPIPPGTVIAPEGTEIVFQTSDPGALVVDLPGDGIDGANPCISPIPCINTVLGFSPQPAMFHRIPSLRGIRHTAPYFHDNSAATLEDSVRHYRIFFGGVQQALYAAAAAAEAQGDTQTAGFLLDVAGALVLSDQDVDDIAAYMRLL